MVQKTEVKSKSTRKAVVKAAPTLYRLVKIPMGNTLRAYFIALISAQVNGLTPAKTFKLWPSVNVSGHLAKANLIKVDGGYQLTADGAKMFADSIPRVGQATVDAFGAAVRTGKAPSAYAYPMVPL